MVFSYAKSTFTKTKRCCHITFLKTCLRRNHIPKGMTLQHTPSNHSNKQLKSVTDRILKQSSIKLMRSHITDSDREVQILSRKINCLKHQINTLCEPAFAVHIKHKVHDLNRLLFDSLTHAKNSKLPSIESPSSASSLNDHSLVCCIPDTLPLSNEERSVLSKGLNFIPLTPKAARNDMMLLLQRFYRTIRWTATLGGTPQWSQEEEDPFVSMFKKKSGTLPPEGKFKAVEKYICKTKEQIAELKPLPLSYSNVTPSELCALRSLQQRRDIVIKPADKGGKVVVWSRDLYISEAIRQLSDTTHYEKLDGSSLMSDTKAITSLLKEEISGNNIPPTAKLLEVKRPRQPCFYMLPKIHKVDNPGRPIVSACSCPTENISCYLDSIFQPFVRSLPTYIKDSTEALLKIEEINLIATFTPTCLFTMDVTALYTNIPHSDGLQALEWFLNKRDALDPPTVTLIRLAELVLTMNMFEFNGEFYRQSSGVAMGTKMGPSYACLFMGYLEHRMKNAYQGSFPQYFGRYIDDCLGIASLPKSEVLAFIDFANKFHPAIRFTFELSLTEINFLDINIQLSGGRLSTSVFYKPTDAHSYLDYCSSHSLSTRNSIPYSQFLRLRRICSRDADFATQASLMMSFFIRRGYPMTVLRSSLERAKSVPRETALLPSGTPKEGRPIVVIPYHPHNLPIKRILLDNWNILHQDSFVGESFSSPPLVAYKRMLNLRDRLVRSRLTGPHIAAPRTGTHPCTKPSCGACPFLDPDQEVKGHSSSFTVRRAFHCQLCNVVYVVTCYKCGLLYIGETERSFETRLKEHLAGIRLGHTNLPVARHFCSPGHSMQDLKAQILWRVKGDIVDRKHLEAWLISRLNTVTPFGLNIKSH